MSVPYVDPSSWVPAAVLVASLAGSGHCASMCGGLVAASARSRSSWCAYQFGRLAGYVVLGGLAGQLGKGLLGESGTSWASWLSWFATAALSLGLVVSGARVWAGRMPHFRFVPAAWLSGMFRAAGARPGATGLFSAFLPCGWLHSFVLGAAATQSPVQGAGLLFLFWVGTLPALATLPWLADRLLLPLSRRSPRAAGLLLILAGAICLGAKAAPAFTGPRSAEAPSCHHHGD